MLLKRASTISLLTAFFAAHAFAQPTLHTLEPIAVLPINGAPPRFEPSGLAVSDGRIFTLSDKHSDTIFELTRTDSAALAKTHLCFTPPADWLDLEGIALDGSNGFWLVSEAHSRILHVSSDGKSNWVSESVLAAGQTAGLFATSGAGLEGLAPLPSGEFLLAAERQPRGLITVNKNGSATRATRFPAKLFRARGIRPEDITDLTTWQGRTFALLRNAHIVCELIPDPAAESGWKEGTLAADFASTERDPRYAYTTQLHGHAEGLAIDDDHLYIVLDNNGTPRATSPTDTRPLLIIFKNPFATP